MNLKDERNRLFTEIKDSIVSSKPNQVDVSELFLKIEEQDKELVKKLKEKIKRGVARNKVFPLDWCFDSIDTIFALQDNDGGSD